MWEPERPERLDALRDQRHHRWVGWIVTSFAIGGLAAILFNAGVFERSPDAVREASPAAPTSRSIQPTSPPPGSAPAPARSPTPPRSSARGSPDVLRTLTETCSYWTAQNTRGQYDGHRQMACQQMVDYARSNGMAVPSVSGSGLTPEASANTQRSRLRQTVPIDECSRHVGGSIEFRQCRAREQQRLSALCTDLRARRSTSRGSAYERISQQATAVCAAAARYDIVR